jgi:hypothetical protein
MLGRKIMSEALQQEGNGKEAAYFNCENLKCHMNDESTLVLTLRDALH